MEGRGGEKGGEGRGGRYGMVLHVCKSIVHTETGLNINTDNIEVCSVQVTHTGVVPPGRRRGVSLFLAK